MKLQEIIDKIVSVAEGAQIMGENRWDDEYVITLLNSFRAQYLRDFYYKNKRINPVCYQKHFPDYESAFQNTGACFAKFKCPNVITLDSHSDGLRYVGSIGEDGDVEAFRRIQSRGTLSTYNNHPVMNVSNNRSVSYLYDGAFQTFELYGNGKYVKRLLVEALFANPLEASTYNQDVDDYPLNDDCLPAIEQMIFASVTRIGESTAPTPAFTPQPMPKK